jgi:hypothetical protein
MVGWKSKWMDGLEDGKPISLARENTHSDLIL